MLSLSEAYNKSVQEESTLTAELLKTRHVGKQDPKRHLEEVVEKAMGDQAVQNLGTMLLTTVRETQKQRLCRAFPFEFWGLSNIFRKESGYFFQYLQFKILVGGGCAKSQFLTRS